MIYDLSYVTNLLNKYRRYIERYEHLKTQSILKIDMGNDLQNDYFSSTRAKLIHYEKIHLQNYNNLIDEYRYIESLIALQYKDLGGK